MRVSLITVQPYLTSLRWGLEKIVTQFYKMLLFTFPPGRVKGMPASYPGDQSHPPFFSEHPPSQSVHSWDKLESKWAAIELCQTQLWQALLQLIVDPLVSLCMSVPIVYPDCWYLFPPGFSLESQSHHASPWLVYIRLTVGYWIMVTVNDNFVVQDRNGSKTNLQDGLQSGRENKSREKRGERSGEEGSGRKGS